MTAERLLGALGIVLTLGGCVGSLLGGGKPDMLYRLDLGSGSDIPSSRPVAANQRALILLPIRFAAEVEGDQLLTTRGEQAKYIKDARWVAPAPVLFKQAVEQAFHTRAPSVLLVSPSHPGGASLAVQFTVHRFDASYERGSRQDGAPVAIIAGDARLIRTEDRRTIMATEFSARHPAAENTVSAIVSAFSGGVEEVAGRVAVWASQAVEE